MKKMKLTDEEVLAECRYQSSQASGSEFASDELTESRKNALRYYLGRSRGDEVAGRSDIQSLDVADMIDAMLTQLMPMFDGDDLVQFEATSEEDENQARTETRFCNHVVMEQNNGFMLFQTLLKDCLLSKNATAKVRVEIKSDTKDERYKGLTSEEVLQVIQPQAENETIRVTKMEEYSGNVNLKRITTKRKLVVEAVAPENFSITSEHKSPYLEDATYCVERYWSTKSDLIEQGFDHDQIMDLPTSTSDTKIDSIERNQINDEQNFFNTNPSMQIVELEEHYIRIDQDGDGVAELHKVLSVENILLSNELVDYIPYANGIAFLMGHRFYGLSVFDKIKNLQDIKTHFLRQWADNALVHNHKKYVCVEDGVEMDDVLNGRPNGVIRVQNINDIMELQSTDIGASCLMALDYYDKIRTERTGSALDLQANQQSMPSNVGDQGVTTLIANLEKVTSLVAKNFSETMVFSVYGLVHKFLKDYFPDQMSQKFGGEWTQTNPGEWSDREQINVTVPPTNSEKIVQQIALEKAMMLSASELSQGKEGITTDEGNVYQLKLDHMRLSGIDNPDKYLINPDSPQAQQRRQQNEQQQQQQQQQMQQKQDMLEQQQIQMQMKVMETQIAEIQRNWENDKEQLRFDYTELQTKTEMDKYKVDVGAEMDEAKIVGDATAKLEVESMQAINRLETEDAKHDNALDQKDYDHEMMEDMNDDS